MYGITALGSGRSPFTSLQFIIPEVFAIASGALFIRHTKVAAAPIIPLRLILKGGYGKLNLISYVNGGCTIGAGLLIPLYAEERYHFKSLEAGTVLSARAVGALCVAGLVAFMIRRKQYVV